MTVLENVQVQLKDNISSKLPSPIPVDQAALENDDINWWETLLEEKVGDGGSTYCSTSGEHSISPGDEGSAYRSEQNTSLCAASDADVIKLVKLDNVNGVIFLSMQIFGIFKFRKVFVEEYVFSIISC